MKIFSMSKVKIHNVNTVNSEFFVFYFPETSHS